MFLASLLFLKITRECDEADTRKGASPPITAVSPQEKHYREWRLPPPVARSLLESRTVRKNPRFKFIPATALFVSFIILAACAEDDEAERVLSESSSPAAQSEVDLTAGAEARPVAVEEKAPLLFDPTREAQEAASVPVDRPGMEIRPATREDRDGYYEARRKAELR